MRALILFIAALAVSCAPSRTSDNAESVAVIGEPTLAMAVPEAPAPFTTSWSATKNAADDVVYAGITSTFYCGCEYRSHEDSDGSGDITGLEACGYAGPDTHSHRAGRVEWEHIVPASLMPAREFECWSGEGGSRDRCEREDPRAQAMLFDLHNLAPSIGQVNALRGNDRYGELSESDSAFGACEIRDTRDLFEPADCTKGDVARVWLYMADRYGVEISDDELTMFEAWAANDPVSPRESERDRRIAELTGESSPWVEGVEPSLDGACAWET